MARAGERGRIRLAGEQQSAGGDPIEPEEGGAQFAAAAADEARDAEHFAAAEFEGDALQFGGAEVFRLQRDLAGRPANGALRGKQLAADHHADQLVDAAGGGFHGADGLAVAQYGGPIADAEDLVHFVRDVDDGDAALPEAGNESEEPFGGVVEERTGGLVHEDDARVHAEGAGNGEQLLLSDGERRDRLPDIAGKADLLEKGAAERFDAPEIDEAVLRENAGWRSRCFRRPRGWGRDRAPGR